MDELLQPRLLALSARVGGPLLALDTSGATAALCLVAWRSGEVRELVLDAAAMPSESLGRVLAEEVAATGLELARLGGIVVGLGPGSFTGLRVGLATAKGLALGAGVPLYGTSSLAMLAASAGPGLVMPVLEARRGEVFAAIYEVAADGDVATVVADRATTPAAARALAQAHGAVRLVGSGAVTLALPVAAPALVPRAGFGILHVAVRLVSRDAEAIAPLAPRYLKLSEAERGQLA